MTVVLKDSGWQNVERSRQTMMYSPIEGMYKVLTLVHSGYMHV